MNTYNIGIVGFGGFGYFLKHSWEKLDNIKVTAVADELPSRDPGGDTKFYNKISDLAADEQVEIVSICTPPSTHAQIACQMMEAGKHVLIEKPMATSVSDARKIIATREKTGVVATVDYMIRFNPMMEAFADITKSGILGKLRHFNLENYAQDEGLPAEHWFWDKEIAGGILIEHAVHFIDISHSLTDQHHVSVNGHVSNRNDRQEDQVLATAKYNDGLIATHYHSFARPGFFEDTSIRLNYDLAQIDIYGWIPLCSKINAIVNNSSISQLKKLPNFKISQQRSVFDVNDDSRPKGMTADIAKTESGSRLVNAGGIDYEVDTHLHATCGIDIPKQAVYANCVRAMLCDLIKKIENPDHKLRVTLEDGLSSLDIACQATTSGRK